MRSLLVTCEHGGNRVPPAFAPCFAGLEDLLDSHRGWDPGALDLARRIARAHHAPLHHSTITRLLVELNRSPDHPQLFSPATRRLPPELRQQILDRYYHPYRQVVMADLARRLPVLHLSIHTFTPVLHGKTRTTEIGILHDPARPVELRLALAWQRALRQSLGLVVHRNRPYRGTSDGFVVALRQRFPDPDYAGLELEVGQRLLAKADWPRVRRAIVDSIGELVAG